MPKRDYHYPGYIRPSQAGKPMLAAHLPPELVAEFKETAAANNMTIGRAVELAARDFILRSKRGKIQRVAALKP